MKDWEPDLYLRFERYRTRPVYDLLARLSLNGLRVIVDLGCGTGNSTSLLVQRWPQAEVIGVDRSTTMLDTSNARGLRPTCGRRLATAKPSNPVHGAGTAKRGCGKRLTNLDFTMACWHRRLFVVGVR